MKYSKILEIKKAIKTLIDILAHNGETRISITKPELEEYLEAIETLETANKDAVECFKKRIKDDTCAGADSSEYLETTIYEVIEQVFGVECVTLDDSVTVLVLDEPEFFKLFSEYPEEFKEEYPHKKYEFKTPKEFVEHWYELPEGNWYWVYHGDNNLVCSGACDPNDLEIFEEYFGDALEEDDEYEEIKNCVEGFIKELELEGVEITEDDYKNISERLTNKKKTLDVIVREYLCEIRELLDDGIEESLNLPKTVLISASELALDTDDIYKNEDELSDIVGNYLSDVYGFCHFSFNMRVAYNENNEPSDVIVTNIQWDTTD